MLVSPTMRHWKFEDVRYKRNEIKNKLSSKEKNPLKVKKKDCDYTKTGNFSKG